MSRTNLLLEQAVLFDKNGSVKHEVEIALGALKEFNQKYPFDENLQTIEWLDPDKLFKLNPDEVGEFFLFLQSYLKPFTNTTLSKSNIYRNARLQIKEFKNLLRITVDNRKSLAQKIDAPWDRIGGFGQDKQLAKKIIYCLNYKNPMILPIFSNQHLRFFVNRVVDSPNLQPKYLSPGQEYENYTADILNAKNSLPLTRSWNNMYFTRFLYKTFPPPDSESSSLPEQRKTTIITEEQLDLQGFMKLLGELQTQQKITGEQFRENRALWMKQPAEREALTKRLKQKLQT